MLFNNEPEGDDVESEAEVDFDDDDDFLPRISANVGLRKTKTKEEEIYQIRNKNKDESEIHSHQSKFANNFFKNVFKSDSVIIMSIIKNKHLPRNCCQCDSISHNLFQLKKRKSQKTNIESQIKKYRPVRYKEYRVAVHGHRQQTTDLTQTNNKR